MKKIDKLVLRSFLTTFALTFLVVTFILLNRQMLMYYDDIIGKGLAWSVIGKFIAYFTIFMVPQALPLSILLAALICYGSLGEHFELTAIKASGISLIRIIQPVFFLVTVIASIAFYLNNVIVPKAALEAFALLYDIRQTKPTLDIKEGTFYNGLPDISIKVNKKFDRDPAALKDVMLYDHQGDNKEVYLADSGRMTTILDNRYLKFELFNGYQYKEGSNRKDNDRNDFSRVKFSKIEMVVDLSSFDMSNTDVRNFSSHRYMMGLGQLRAAIDSLTKITEHASERTKSLILDARHSDRTPRQSIPVSTPVVDATARAREIKAILENNNAFEYENTRQIIAFQVQWHRIISYSFACITMLLIGAPLGAIIKKGGLGLPFLISIIFFIVFFVCDMQGEKLSNRQVIQPVVGMWIGNTSLMLIALYLLHHALIDGRLFDLDYYLIRFEHGKRMLQKFRAKRLGIFSNF